MLKYINPFDKEFPAALYTFALVAIMFIGWARMGKKGCNCDKATDATNNPSVK